MIFLSSGRVRREYGILSGNSGDRRRNFKLRYGPAEDRSGYASRVTEGRYTMKKPVRRPHTGI
jgi:hypothetical protein